MNYLAQDQAIREDSVFVFSERDEVRDRVAAALGGARWNVHTYLDPGDAAAFSHIGGASASSVGIVAVEGSLLFFPVGVGSGACARCLHQTRLAQKIPYEIAAHRKGAHIDVCALAHLSAFALGLIAPIVAFVAERAEQSGSGGGVALDLVSLKTTAFSPHGQSSCQLCSVAPAQALAQGSLVHRQKMHAGAYRCKKLSDYTIDIKRYVNPINGMLGKALLQNRELPFYALTNGRFYESELLREAPIDWFGTAQTYRESAIVGIFEGLERHAGLIARDRSPNVKMTYAQADGRAVHPARLGLYEEASYDADESLLRFTPETSLEWVWGHSVAKNAPVLVPSDFVYYGARQMIYGNSSGCATGSCVEEALLFGLLETIERDAFMLHWLTRLAPRQIAVESINDLECKTIITRLAAAGAQLYLLDARLDLPIPVVMAVIVREPGQYGTFSMAAGASFDPVEAVRRALGEVAVHYHVFEERSQDAARGRLADAWQDFSSVKGLEDHALLYGMPEALLYAKFLTQNEDKRDFDDTYAAWQEMRPRSLSLLDDVNFFFDSLRTAGHDEVIWVDQTSSEQLGIGLRTVRAIVPGLLPIDFGHGRCRAATLPRLYALPQQLGLRDRLLTADDINRAPHPFP